MKDPINRPDVPTHIAALRTCWPQNPELPNRDPHWSFDPACARVARKAYHSSLRSLRAYQIMEAMLA